MSRDPKVIFPVGFDCEKAWKGCQQSVEDQGGLTHDDGEVNWGAASSADPGITSCPACFATYWAWGTVVECLDCQFRFPTHWWSEYSYGVQAAGRTSAEVKRKCANSPFYRYGFENPPKDYESLFDLANSLPWKEIMAGVEFKEPPSPSEDLAYCRRCGERKSGSRERSTCLCLKCDCETSCIHRRGMGWHEDQQMKPCAAGVVLYELTGRAPGCGLKKPCKWIDGGEPVACEHFTPTPIETLIADDAEMEKSMAEFMLVGPIVRKVKDERKGQDWSGVEQCPVCEGKLHLSHSRYNGHVHGACETKDCLAWVE